MSKDDEQIEEALSPWRLSSQKPYAKRKIKALIAQAEKEAYKVGWNARNELPETELERQARIELLEEILELPDTNGGCPDSQVKAKFTSWFEQHLNQLREVQDE